MGRRAKLSTTDLFLTANAVVTRLAMRELKKAKVDPAPLLARAGISLLKLGEEPSGLQRRAKFGSWKLPQRRSTTQRWVFTLLKTLTSASAECFTMSWLHRKI